MNSPATGKITFLFTDIEGSTRLAQKYPELMQSVLLKHHAILRSSIESSNGFVFEIIGDAFCASFNEPASAIIAAIEIQKKLAAEKWDIPELKVRIGIHTGEADWNGERYSGYITLATMNRVMSAAYGGQILVSGSTFTLLNEPITGITFRDLGLRKLKDIKEPVNLYQVISEGLRQDFPPLKTPDARLNDLPVLPGGFYGRDMSLHRSNKLYMIQDYLQLPVQAEWGRPLLQ